MRFFFFYYFLFSLCFLSGQSIRSVKELLNSKKSIDNKISSNIIDQLEELDDEDSSDNDYLKEDVEILSRQDKSVNETESESESESDFFEENNVLINDDIIEKVRDENSSEILQELNEQKTQKLYFGYNVFKSDPDLFQKSAVESVDPSYLIGPGDEIILMLWGQIEQNKVYTVSKEGYLFIPDIGQVFVNGLNLEQLEKKLLRVLKKVHSSLGSNNTPATTFDVSLGSSSLRPIRIFALGELDQPGAYAVKPNSTFFTAMYYFGGPSLSGTLRNVKLIRNKKK